MMRSVLACFVSATVLVCRVSASVSASISRQVPVQVRNAEPMRLNQADLQALKQEVCIEQNYTVGHYSQKNEYLQIMHGLLSADPETALLLELDSNVMAMLPWDMAFTSIFSDSYLSKLLQDDWKLHRRDLVLYHFTNDYVPPPNLSKSKKPQEHSQQRLSMMNGDRALFEVEKRRIYINRMDVLASRDFEETARIYMLKQVLPRPWMTKSVLDVAFDKFQYLCNIAGIEHELADPEATITLFLPPATTFHDYSPSMPKDELAFFLRFHMVKDRVLLLSKEELKLERIRLPNDAGHTLTIERDIDANVSVNGVTVVGFHQLARNGIVYHMDAILPRPVCHKTQSSSSSSSNPAARTTAAPTRNYVMSRVNVGAY